MTNSLDDVDFKILDMLVRDSRASFRQIALELGLGVTTVIRRVEAMEKRGVISGYSAKLNHEKLASEVGTSFFPICFFIRVRPGYEVKKVIEDISKTKYFEFICYMYHVAGDFEIAAMAKCLTRKGATSLIESISRIEGVERITPHAVLETYKEELGPKPSIIKESLKDLGE
ncbi:MAG: Lrp/AsnC family transcriptional regulator [Candidatus Freyarchaeota archaeon]